MLMLCSRSPILGLAVVSITHTGVSGSRMNEGTSPFPRRCGVLKAWTALITAAMCNVNARASAVVQARAGAELYYS